MDHVATTKLVYTSLFHYHMSLRGLLVMVLRTQAYIGVTARALDIFLSLAARLSQEVNVLIYRSSYWHYCCHVSICTLKDLKDLRMMEDLKNDGSKN